VRLWLETARKAGADTSEAAGILLDVARRLANQRPGAPAAEALEALDRAIYMAEQINRHGCEASNAASTAGKLLSRITTGIWDDAGDGL
jgi:hypothetical protein